MPDLATNEKLKDWSVATTSDEIFAVLNGHYYHMNGKEAQDLARLLRLAVIDVRASSRARAHLRRARVRPNTANPSGTPWVQPIIERERAERRAMHDGTVL
jgi:hypothetical protein